MKCPVCKKWEITDFDIFCGWCRTKLVDFVVWFNVDHVCAGDIAPESLALTLTHTGTIGTITVEKIESSQPWMIIRVDQLADLTLRVGNDLVVPIEMDLLSVADDYHKARVTVSSSVGTREAVLEVTPRPKFQINTGGEQTVLLDNVQDEIMSGYLAVTRGVLTVESMATDVPWATVERKQPATLPCKLDQRGDNRLEFVFRINESYVLAETARSGQPLPVEHKATLLVKLAEFEQPRKEIFRVTCFLPPLLYIPEAEEHIRRRVFAGKRGEFDLTLQNGERDEPGHANLQVREIKIDAAWLETSGTINYPLTIASGRFHGLTLTATTTDLGEGVHPARVIFITNTPGELREKSVIVDIEVCRMPEFGGVLAIDFGTTNSCCAILNQEGLLELIPVGDLGDGKQTTVSSAILYQDLFDDNVKDYIIGNKAYEISFQPSAAYSAVRQLKRLLGSAKPLSINFYQDPTKQASYLPREVATDIIRRILERAEEHVHARITSCTISHPSRFSLGQIEDLKEAIVACGLAKGKIRTVHEPIGAALDFIQQTEAREKYQQYHLMVFDFGGGTTDITLMHVQNEYLPERKLTKVTTEVLGTTGDRWLGGEDVTEMVMSLVQSRCETLLRLRYPDALNIVLPFDAEDFTEARRKRLAQQNRHFLRFWAEAAKIAISTYGDEHQEALERTDLIDGSNIKSRLPKSFQLAVIVDNDIRQTETFFHDEVVPQQAEIDEQLRPKLEGMAKMMKELAQYHDVKVPEFILLSGKSSALPVVHQVIKEYFPAANIRQPNDLKECVVRGACQVSSRDPIAGVQLVFKGAKTTMTSHLGLRARDPNTGLPVFNKVIDAGRPIGPDGLSEPVLGISVNRETDIRILENTGGDEWISRNGEVNRNITVLKVSQLDAKLAEWEQEHGKHVTDQDLENAHIELIVTPDLAVKLLISVPGIDNPLAFEAEWGGG